MDRVKRLECDGLNCVHLKDADVWFEGLTPKFSRHLTFQVIGQWLREGARFTPPRCSEAGLLSALPGKFS